MPLSTEIGEVYDTGTIHVIYGSTAVEGVGTAWLVDIYAGDYLVVDGLMCRIESVEADDALTLTKPFPGSPSSPTFYYIDKLSYLRNDFTTAAMYARNLFSATHDPALIYQVPAGEEPDPSKGEEGWYAFRAAPLPWKFWHKETLAWVDLGAPLGTSWQGAWDAITTWQVNDVVSDDGATWVSKTTNTNKKPASNPSDWDKASDKGAPGNDGGLILPYTLSNSTSDSDPGNGIMRFGNFSSQKDATVLRLDLLDNLGRDWSSLFTSLAAGTSTIQFRLEVFLASDRTKFIAFNATAVASPSGYKNITVAQTGFSAASPFSNGDALIVAITPTGDKGTTGSTGTAATIAVGSVSALPAGSTPTVANSGSSSAATLDFGIPSGADGVDPGIRFTFDNGTAVADPGSGNLRSNNGSIASTTILVLSALCAETGNPDVSDFTSTWSSSTTTANRGTILIRKVIAPENFLILRISGAVTDATDYLTIPVSVIKAAGSFADGDILSAEWQRSGDAGAGSGDVVAENNLSDIPEAYTAKDNLSVKASDVLSATTTDIWAAHGDSLHVTGTTTITSFGTPPKGGLHRTLIFDGSLVLTHGTNLVLPGAANIQTAANDRAIVLSDTTSKSIVVAYIKADGTPVAIASQAQAEAGISDATVLTPLKASQQISSYRASFKNIVGRNGGLEVMQRPNPASVSASATDYTIDGFYLSTGGSQACTVTQTTGLVDGSVFSGKVQRNSGQTGTGTLRFAMPLDTDELVKLRGKTVVLSFTIKEGANQSFGHSVAYNLYCGTGAVTKRNGSAYTSESNPISGTATTTTTAARVVSSVSSAIGASITQAELQFSITPSGTAGADDSFTIDDIQLEVVPAGISTVTPVFERTDYLLDLMRCMRHYEIGNFDAMGGGSGGYIGGRWYAKVTKRTGSPTITQSFTGGNVSLPATCDNIGADGCRFFTTNSNVSCNFDGPVTCSAEI